MEQLFDCIVPTMPVIPKFRLGDCGENRIKVRFQTH